VADVPPPADSDGLEPADGDVVVVRASIAPDGRPAPTTRALCAVIEWGSFRLASPDHVDLPIDVAQVQARLVASRRRRAAWDSSGHRVLRLRRVPLISVQPGGTFWLTVDVTDVTDARADTRWQSHFYLTESQALDLLAENGFPGRFGRDLLAAARQASSPPMS
jgi:hypothetical protein